MTHYHMLVFVEVYLYIGNSQKAMYNAEMMKKIQLDFIHIYNHYKNLILIKEFISFLG